MAVIRVRLQSPFLKSYQLSEFTHYIYEAEAEARKDVEVDAEAETWRSANEIAERDTEKARKMRGPGPAEREGEGAGRVSDTSNESQLLELVYEERAAIDVESYLLEQASI